MLKAILIGALFFTTPIKVLANMTGLFGISTDSKTQLGIYYLSRKDYSEGLGFYFDIKMAFQAHRQKNKL